LNHLIAFLDCELIKPALVNGEVHAHFCSLSQLVSVQGTGFSIVLGVPISVLILDHKELEELQELPVASDLEHPFLNWVQLIHLKASHEAHLHSIAAVEC